MKRYAYLLIVILALAGCKTADTLRTGDLVFVGIPQDYDEQRHQ